MKTELQMQILSGAVEDALIEKAEASLNDEQRRLYEMQLIRGKKNIVVAYLLWFLFGGYQLHMLYLGIFDKAHLRNIRLIGLILTYFVIGMIIIIPLWFYDAFKMPSYMKDANRLRKAKILVLMVSDEKIHTEVNAMEYDFATPRSNKQFDFATPIIKENVSSETSEEAKTNINNEEIPFENKENE